MSFDLQARTTCPDCRRTFAYSRRHPPRSCPYCNEPLDHDDALPQADEPENQILIPGTQKDDGKPYGVLGKKPPPMCPECRESLNEGDPVCPRCNFNHKTGKHVPKAFPVFDRTWEPGVGLRYRLIALGVCQAMNIVMFLLINQAIEDVPTTLTGWFFIALLQAFLLGTFDRVRIQRTTKGKVNITKMWRACFVPLKPKVLNWRGLEEVGIRRNDVGWFEWYICILLLCDGIIPGILWWWFALRTDRASAVLMKDQGAIEHTLYSGTDPDKAEEIAQAVHDLTALPYKAVG